MSDEALLVIVHNLSRAEKIAVECYLKSVFGKGSVSRKYGELCVQLPMLNQFDAAMQADTGMTALEAEYRYLWRSLDSFFQQLQGSFSHGPEYDEYIFERIIFR